MKQHLFISLSLLLVCEFTLAQQDLRLIAASPAEVCRYETELDSIAIQTQSGENFVLLLKENSIIGVKRHTYIYGVPKSALNIKDKSFAARFWFGGQRAVLLAYQQRVYGVYDLDRKKVV